MHTRRISIVNVSDMYDEKAGSGVKSKFCTWGLNCFEIRAEK